MVLRLGMTVESSRDNSGSPYQKLACGRYDEILFLINIITRIELSLSSCLSCHLLGTFLRWLIHCSCHLSKLVCDFLEPQKPAFLSILVISFYPSYIRLLIFLPM